MDQKPSAAWIWALSSGRLPKRSECAAAKTGQQELLGGQHTFSITILCHGERSRKRWKAKNATVPRRPHDIRWRRPNESESVAKKGRMTKWIHAMIERVHP